MDRIRHRRYIPTPATVLSLLALSISLGGTAWAVVTITGKEVKNNSLTGKDIKDLRGGDVRDGALTGKDIADLSGADVKDGSIEGRDIKDGSLAKADVASATDSDKLDGLDSSDFVRASRLVKIFNSVAAGTTVSFFSAGNLAASATCSAASQISLAFTTTRNDSTIQEVATDTLAAATTAAADYNFDTGETYSSLALGNHHTSIAYAATDSSVVSLELQTTEGALGLGGTAACLVSGTAVVG